MKKLVLFITLVLTLYFSALSQDKRQGNLSLTEVTQKELRAILKEYEQVIMERPFKFFLKENGNCYFFKITEPIPGQTFTAADFHLDAILRLNSITSGQEVFTFQKDGPNKDIILIKVIAFKK